MLETEEEVLAPALAEASAAAGSPQAVQATVVAEPVEPQARRVVARIPAPQTTAPTPAAAQEMGTAPELEPAVERHGAEGGAASSSPYVTQNALGV